jgi:hypothetical protein
MRSTAMLRQQAPYRAVRGAVCGHRGAARGQTTARGVRTASLSQPLPPFALAMTGGTDAFKTAHGEVRTVDSNATDSRPTSHGSARAGRALALPSPASGRTARACPAGGRAGAVVWPDDRGAVEPRN